MLWAYQVGTNLKFPLLQNKMHRKSQCKNQNCEPETGDEFWTTEVKDLSIQRSKLACLWPWIAEIHLLQKFLLVLEDVIFAPLFWYAKI